MARISRMRVRGEAERGLLTELGVSAPRLTGAREMSAIKIYGGLQERLNG